MGGGRFFVAACVATATACASTGGPMHRALDPSMERVVSTENYIRGVAGITGDGTRLMRGDGYTYLADVAPQLRYLALTGDSASYRRLRRFADARLVERDAAGARPRQRVREGSAVFDAASPYDAQRFRDALAAGWLAFADTASAVLAAGLRPVEATGATSSSMEQLVEQCATAEAAVATNPAGAQAVLRSAKQFHGAPAETSGVPGLRGADGDLVVLSCLTRLGLAVRDPDATVRFLDRLLDTLAPYLRGSGRPDTGVAAEVLLTLRAVVAAGPGYYRAR